MVKPTDISTHDIWTILTQICDPEIPVLTITDLGIVREVRLTKSVIENKVNNDIEIFITPTYTGCPAMDMIAASIRLTLLEHGYNPVKVTTVLSPAWSTDWMTEAGKEKLKAYGIAPPAGKAIDQKALEVTVVECPQCHSKNTRLISAFGSTACKALFQCTDCKEPFDYFKCH